MTQAQILKNRKVRLKVGDTGRQVRAWMSDPIAKDQFGNRLPVDLSASGTSVVLNMKRVGGDGTIIPVPCTKLAGIVDQDGELTAAAPYNVAGSGGIVQVDWTSPSVATAGDFKGEFEITFETGKQLTLYDQLDIHIKATL